jgi:hypothetical protein
MSRLLAVVLVAVAPVEALRIDITHADIERALVIARSTDAERATFHARYVQRVNSPFVDRVEVVSELRRVVLTAEERVARGDRFFAYSATRANEALEVFRRRISVIAHVRFHPLNNYISLPAITMAVDGNPAALIGVRRDPVYGFSSKPGDAAPILGAVVEGSFEAQALGQARREFVVVLDGKELGRAAFDLGVLE